MKTQTLPFSYCVVLFASACGGGEHEPLGDDVYRGSAPEAADAVAAALAAAPAPSAEATVHKLSCGCVLDAVGMCGEYIEVDGAFVKLTPPVNLGVMPFCAKQGLEARVDGELEGDVFVAETFAYVD